ncbi:MAG TPA: PAS domain S-box protein, partial [Vicinamibacteria bacterium]
AAKQAAILNALPTHVALLDGHGLILSVNAAWQTFARANAMEGTGYGVGQSYLDVCDRAQGNGASEAHQVAEGIRTVLAGSAQSFALEYRCDSPTDRRWFLLNVTPLPGERPSGAVVMHSSITDRKESEEALEALSLKTQRRERLLTSALSSMSDFAQVYDRQGRLLFVNQALLDLWGLPLDEVVGKNFSDLGYPQVLAERLRRQLQQVLETKRSVTDETPYTSPSGVSGYYEYIFSPVIGADGTADFVVGSTRDVTERKQTELAISASEARFAKIFHSRVVAIAISEMSSGRLVDVNERWAEFFGYSRDEVIGRTVRELDLWVVPADRERLLDGISAGSPTSRTETSFRRKSGEIVWALVSMEAISLAESKEPLVIVVLVDMTERKQLESQLLHAQKMDAVGRLAGGVAHDFNNSLGVILGYTELLLPKAGAAERGKLEQILKATNRAAGLTRQLLAFSRKQIVNPRVLDLNLRLADLEKMLGRLIGEHIGLTIVLGEDLGQVKADLGQLEQVVVNLCVNARDAMPGGGMLRIETSNAQVDARQTVQHVQMTPGRYVMLAVSDNGCGIEKEVLPQIFEPFFTTKEEGKGTGLGLAMVYGIVKQAGGYVWAESEVGRGATFKVYLPRFDEPPAPDIEATPMPARGTETILLVEDEGPLREIAREILEAHGYRVLDAPGANEAIEIARSHPQPIHLLLTDVVMPGMNGRALAESLVVTRPEIKVLYMSGYTADLIAHSGVLDAGLLLIEKPFTALLLLGRVREVLGDGGVIPGT